MLLPAGTINHAKDLTCGVKPVFSFACLVKHRGEQKGMHFIKTAYVSFDRIVLF